MDSFSLLWLTAGLTSACGQCALQLCFAYGYSRNGLALCGGGDMIFDFPWRQLASAGQASMINVAPRRDRLADFPTGQPGIRMLWNPAQVRPL